MFEQNVHQEMAIKYPWMMQVAAENARRGISTMDRLRMYKNGANIFRRTHRLDRKIQRCYPRGPAFEEMVLMSHRGKT